VYQQNYKLYLIFFSFFLLLSRFRFQQPRFLGQHTNVSPNNPSGYWPKLPCQHVPATVLSHGPPHSAAAQHVLLPNVLLLTTAASHAPPPAADDDDAIEKIIAYLKDDNPTHNWSFQMSLDYFSSGSSDDCK